MENWKLVPWQHTDWSPPSPGRRVVGTESFVHKPVLYDYTKDGQWISVCPQPVGVVSSRPPLWMPIRHVAQQLSDREDDVELTPIDFVWIIGLSAVIGAVVGPLVTAALNFIDWLVH